MAGIGEGGRLRRQIFFDHLQVADDHLEDVVEIVGDPAGEAADDMHLLGSPQLLLGALLIGPVDDDAEDRRHGAVFVDLRNAAYDGMTDVAVGAFDPDRHLKLGPVGDGVGDSAVDDCLVVGKEIQARRAMDWCEVSLDRPNMR